MEELLLKLVCDRKGKCGVCLCDNTVAILGRSSGYVLSGQIVSEFVAAVGVTCSKHWSPMYSLWKDSFGHCAHSSDTSLICHASNCQRTTKKLVLAILVALDADVS